MTAETVSAKHTASGRVAKVNYDFGDNLEQMVERFGKEVVHSNAKQAIRISLQSRLRSAMDVAEGEKEPSDKDLQANADSWKPGVASATRKSPVEKAKESVSKLSPEERKALLAELKGS